MPTRRSFLKSTLAGTAALAAGCAHDAGQSNAVLKSTQRLDDRHFAVESIDRVTVCVPFRETPRRSMDRELPHWRYSEICTVTLASGKKGHGETLLYYTWGVTGDNDVQRAIGKNARQIMRDDTLGAGLQMALFDAVGKTLDEPVHALLAGEKLHNKTPLSWWNIDTSAADMASECKLAFNSGYMSYKTKGRPWFDIFEQLKQATTVVPEAFKIDMDFNETLLTAERGLPILKELEKYPQVDIYESPIPQSDIAGNRKIRDATRVNIAMHFGTPEPEIAVREGVCDGFVIGGGASRVLEQGAFAEKHGLPFWLQLVGTGITAAWSLHFGGVSRNAAWPAVNCHQLYQRDLLAEPILVKNGLAQVPDRPGIGHEIDWDAVDKFKTAKPDHRPEPERLLITTWPSGRKMYIASNGKVNYLLTRANQGLIPYYVSGAHTELFPNDGSDLWRRLYTAAQDQPIFQNR